MPWPKPQNCDEGDAVQLRNLPSDCLWFYVAQQQARRCIYRLDWFCTLGIIEVLKYESFNFLCTQKRVQVTAIWQAIFAYSFVFRRSACLNTARHGSSAPPLQFVVGHAWVFLQRQDHFFVGHSHAVPTCLLYSLIQKVSIRSRCSFQVSCSSFE